MNTDPTPAELLLLQRTAHLVSGNPISAVSKQFAKMLRAHVAAENAATLAENDKLRKGLADIATSRDENAMGLRNQAVGILRSCA